MPEAVTVVRKDPARVEIGKRAMAKRWSDPAARKVVRIDSLTLEQRAVVLALVAAAKKAVTPAKVTAQEVDRASDQTPTRAA